MKSVVCSLHFTLRLHFTAVCSPQSSFYTNDFQSDCQQSGSEIRNPELERKKETEPESEMEPETEQ